MTCLSPWGSPGGLATAAVIAADLSCMSSFVDRCDSFPLAGGSRVLKQSHIISRNAAEIVAVPGAPPACHRLSPGSPRALGPALFTYSNWRLEILSSVRTKGPLSHSNQPADSVPPLDVFRVGGLRMSVSWCSPTSWRPPAAGLLPPLVVLTPCLLHAF